MATESALIKVHVKSPSNKYDVEIAADASVSELKDKVLVFVPTANKEQVCIIYTGKILKDEETLTQHKIADGHTVHLVIRNQARPTPAPAAATPTASSAPSSNPTPSSQPNPTNNPFAAMGGMGSPADILNNPDAMRSVMDNPITQQLLGNPEFMRTIIQSNPQFQALIERNPEVGHILNDPNVMRQTMEMIRNPNMFQEMMRNHDQAIRNLQGIPGGEAALERLYNDVQEPLLNSATNSLSGNPFASLRGDQSSEPRVDRAGQENNEALPNPWASNANQATNNQSNNRSADFNSLLDSPGISSLMEQMMSNPSMQASMFSPEVINSIRQNMSNNPGLIDSIVGQIPSARDNPQISEGIRRSFPQMLNMMSDPSVMEAMRNPRVSEAFRQIQEGFSTLRREAPQLLNLFQAGAMGGGAFGSDANASSAGANSANGLADLFNSMNMGGGRVSILNI
ncbi:Ubiquilin [Caenorhabditis elegans]|uniref:Isoform c of Ubiquilin n=1 Tax=Caenorhabditis elegans TaxID=6239 RepID=G5EFF7-3|nr:Ubiquilin [Caenorhabditis elegans]CAD44116.1 Ubiquilin [Caenorhabditis elegans]|eukprot:NP_740885.1 Ubiquilin [Caenorhabditis elegans]